MTINARDYLFEREPSRFALVACNPDYEYLASVHSARLDAKRMSACLVRLGFTVTVVRQLESVIDFETHVLPAFREKVQPGDIVVFYFSGHGFTYGPHNYIAPADLPLVVNDHAIAAHAIAVEALEDYFAARAPGLVLMLIDACRTIAGFVIKDSSGPKEIAASAAARVGTPERTNTIEVYAARAGTVALASNAAATLSPFTKSLAEHIDRKGVELLAMLKDVAADVLLATHQTQNPGIVSWSATDAYLNPTDEIRSREKEAWLAALRADTREEIERFRIRHALSRHAEAAEAWLADGTRKAGNGERRAGIGNREAGTGTGYRTAGNGQTLH